MKNVQNGSAVSEASIAPSQLIDAKIDQLGGWRGEMLGRVRAAVAMNTSTIAKRAASKRKLPSSTASI